MSVSFSTNCKRCKRLANFLAESREQFPDYYCKPVPSFGDSRARLLIVGLAPGLHGANATGRPFTGDYAGILLYETLHRFGYANRDQSVSADDGLRLKHCRITNAVRCVPPQNKPVGEEIRNCNKYLSEELDSFRSDGVILALGKIAHDAVLTALKVKKKDFPFGHGNLHSLSSDRRLLDSYHCSRYNTQTRRLTTDQFHEIFATINDLLKSGPL